MSKKKNKKFKKSHSTNIVRTNPAIFKPQMPAAKSGDRPDDVVEEVRVAEPAKLDPYEELDQKYRGVRREVKKILAILGTLVVLLVGVHFLRTETDVLDSAGDYLYRLANIQAQ